jgi:hypothetical protein
LGSSEARLSAIWKAECSSAWMGNAPFFLPSSISEMKPSPTSFEVHRFKIIKNFPKRRDQRTKNFQEHTEAVFDNLGKLCQKTSIDNGKNF